MAGPTSGGPISEAVSSALPLDGSDDSLLDPELADRIAHGLHAGAERGRELASTAAERSAPLVEAARKRGGELAQHGRRRSATGGQDARKRARKRGAQLAETVRDER